MVHISMCVHVTGSEDVRVNVRVIVCVVMTEGVDSMGVVGGCAYGEDTCACKAWGVFEGV